jgi:hypothetical protein
VAAVDPSFWRREIEALRAETRSRRISRGRWATSSLRTRLHHLDKANDPAPWNCICGPDREAPNLPASILEVRATNQVSKFQV